jgi:transposase
MPAPFRLPPLEPETQQAVLATYNDTTDPELRTRCQMVLLAADYQATAPQIAVVVQRSHDTVLRVLRRFAEGGLAALPDHYCTTGHPRVTAAWHAELERVIDLDPREVAVASANWTTGLLAEHLARVTAIAVDAETVRTYLHRRGYVCKRPTWTLDEKRRSREDWVGNASGWRSC